MIIKKRFITYLGFFLVNISNGYSIVLNDPYSNSKAYEKTYYTSYSGQPKTLDPAKSYSADEYQFIGQIYEPILQYEYLTRPYKLEPLTANDMPVVNSFDKFGLKIESDTSHAITKSIYTIKIKTGINYQPHPAFAKDLQGKFYYQDLDDDYLETNFIDGLADFKYQGTRELVADDYIYQIKRLANPKINSPIYGLMADHIVGFREFAKQLPKKSKFIDLRDFNISGVRKIDKYTFEIILNGQYPQFQFWLSMPFFAPIPWEVDKFYAQPGMEEKNLGLAWYPVGTGPFMLTENNPNSRMELTKNPNYHDDTLPFVGDAEDIDNGYLLHAGEKLPLIDRAVYTLEKESIPRWNKFLQGYYDLSGISADSFDQAIAVSKSGKAVLTPEIEDKGIRLEQVTDPSIYYLGFNMMDPIVGGSSDRARNLRHAISIVMNYDEYISIFFNGRGDAAQGPIPPGIFGFREGKDGINSYVYTWDGERQNRRTVLEANKLMKKAGYPNGRDPKTGNKLILHYDVATSGGPDEKAQLNWMRKQFDKIGIALNVRATQYNRFQHKMRSGNAQIFFWGWNADYPDPENFLFLLYSKNGKVKHGGENAANYNNPKYDKLFEQMINLPNDKMRQEIIDKMIDIVRYDAPWVWGINTKTFILTQQWVAPIKKNSISQNTLKYLSIDTPLRNKLRNKWNQALLWPIGLFILLIILFLLPFVFAFKAHNLAPAARVNL